MSFNPLTSQLQTDIPYIAQNFDSGNFDKWGMHETMYVVEQNFDKLNKRKGLTEKILMNC